MVQSVEILSNKGDKVTEFQGSLRKRWFVNAILLGKLLIIVAIIKFSLATEVHIQLFSYSFFVCLPWKLMFLYSFLYLFWNSFNSRDIVVCLSNQLVKKVQMMSFDTLSTSFASLSVESTRIAFDDFDQTVSYPIFQFTINFHEIRHSFWKSYEDCTVLHSYLKNAYLTSKIPQLASLRRIIKRLKYGTKRKILSGSFVFEKSFGDVDDFTLELWQYQQSELLSWLRKVLIHPKTADDSRLREFLGIAPMERSTEIDKATSVRTIHKLSQANIEQFSRQVTPVKAGDESQASYEDTALMEKKAQDTEVFHDHSDFHLSWRGKTLDSFEFLDLSPTVRSMSYGCDKNNHFLVRGPNYLEDHEKIPSGPSLSKYLLTEFFEAVAPDVRIDHVGLNEKVQRRIDIIRKSLVDPPYILLINLQIPGDPPISIVAYFALPKKYIPSFILEEDPLLQGMHDEKDTSLSPVDVIAKSMVHQFLDIPLTGSQENLRLARWGLASSTTSMSNSAIDNGMTTTADRPVEEQSNLEQPCHVYQSDDSDADSLGEDEEEDSVADGRFHEDHKRAIFGSLNGVKESFASMFNRGKASSRQDDFGDKCDTRSEKSEKSERSERSERSEKSEKSERSRTSDRSGRGRSADQGRENKKSKGVKKLSKMLSLTSLFRKKGTVDGDGVDLEVSSQSSDSQKQDYFTKKYGVNKDYYLQVKQAKQKKVASTEESTTSLFAINSSAIPSGIQSQSSSRQLMPLEHQPSLSTIDSNTAATPAHPSIGTVEAPTGGLVPGDVTFASPSQLGGFPLDDFRNKRFKMIPSIVEGPWVVKMAVRSTPVILGQRVAQRYFRGPGYFELDVDVGSSIIASKIVGLCRGYSSALNCEIGIVIEGQGFNELPERLLAGFSTNHVDFSKINA